MDEQLQQMFGLPGDIQFDPAQLDAIEACCTIERRLVPTTGKAGTGKTLLIKEIHKRLTAAGYLVACSAPTGKAARRIHETCGIPAVTNHRLLGYGMPIEHTEVDERTGNRKFVRLSTGPRYTRSSPLPFDTLLCDEYAMVNQELHRNLIAALKPGARICMFGDMNQLKPIEEDKRTGDEPSAFQVALNKFKGIELPTIHRQHEGSGIAENGARVIAGRMPIRHADFDIINTNDPVHVIREFVLAQGELGVDYATIDHQIITCMNKGWIGTKKLNQTIQALYWDRTLPSLSLPRHRWGNMASKKGDDNDDIRVQVGTKVVYTTNAYDLGNEQSVFNGEVGVVTALDSDDGSVEIDFGDRIVLVPPIIVAIFNDGRAVEMDPRKSIDLAYVLTTHKCQGSEYKHVCYVLNKSTQYAQSRRNMYTGITRGREHVTLITDMLSMAKSTKYAG